VGKHKDGTANEAKFHSYRQGYFYYLVKNLEDGTNHMFTVPAKELGEATILRNDKAIAFMRWIRSAMSEGTLIRQRP
jgi:hypothetical protein